MPHVTSAILVRELLTLRERCVADYGLIQALDCLEMDSATREATVRALYSRVPRFWRWLAGPISKDLGEIEDGLARYTAYPRRDDPVARRATKRVTIRLIEKAIACVENRNTTKLSRWVRTASFMVGLMIPPAGQILVYFAHAIR